MSTAERTAQRRAVEHVTAHVISRWKQGADQAQIASELEDMGYAQPGAGELVDAVVQRIEEISAREQIRSGALFRSAVVGVAAAGILGAAWGWAVHASGYPLGIGAWLLGIVTGLAVNLGAGGARGRPLQVVALAAAVLGIAAGKGVTFALAGQLVPVTWLDGVWVVLAAVCAWQFPRASLLNRR